MFIRLYSIAIFAHHGVYEEELKNGSHFEIDLEVEVPDTLGTMTDLLSDALDYTKLYDAVLKVSEEKRYNLLEAFASDICTKIMRIFLNVISTGVKVRKLNAPVGGAIKSVEVEFKKRRGE